MRISDWSSDVCSSDLNIVVLGDLLQAEGDVVPGADPLGRVDRAGLHGRQDLSRRRQHDDRAGAAQDLAAEAGHADLQALQNLPGVDLAADTAAGPGAARTGLEGTQATDATIGSAPGGDKGGNAG